LDNVTVDGDLSLDFGNTSLTVTNGLNLGSHTIHVVVDNSVIDFANAQTLASCTISLEGRFQSIDIGRGSTFTLGTAAATAGTGQVTFEGQLDNTNANLVMNDTTGSWRLVEGEIDGGTLTFTTRVLQITSGGGTLNGVTINGDLGLTDPGANVTIVNGLDTG